MAKLTKPDMWKERRPVLETEQLVLLFSVLVREPALLARAAESLRTSRFAPNHLPFRWVWDSLSRLYTLNSAIPPLAVLQTDLQATYRRAKRSGGTFEGLEDDDVRLINQLLKRARGYTAEDLAALSPFVTPTLQQLLEEQLQRELQQHASDENSLSMFPMLEHFSKEAGRIASVSMGSIGELFSDDDSDLEDDELFVARTTTGCDFLDHYMGGSSPGEVYGFAAPYGVGKTTLSVQLAVNQIANLRSHRQDVAAKEHRRAEDIKLPTIYLVYYEEPIISVKQRLLSCAGQLPKSLFEERNIRNNMSTSVRGNYKPYERELFRDAFATATPDKPVAGEAERYRTAKQLINSCIRVLDFTGANPVYSAASADMSRGIAAAIAADQQATGNPGVSAVLVDYAVAAAYRHCLHRNLDPDRAMRNLVGRFPLMLINDVCAPYNCFGWCFTQLNTESNNLAPGQAPKTTALAEARNFFENCTFGFMLGTATPDGLTVISAKKFRRRSAQSDRIIRVRGDFSRLEDTNNRYRVENNQIISQYEYERMQLNHAAATATNGNGGGDDGLSFQDLGLSTDAPW